MSKHDRAKQEKRLRNLIYANRYRQWVCKSCKHRTSRTTGKRKCPKCGGATRLRHKP